MPKAKIYEIFRSVQGEGKYVGIKQVFIRFYECNMHCVWCDTPASIGDSQAKGHFEEYSTQELFDKIQELDIKCKSVSLTGGEPLMQKDFIKDFLPILKKSNMEIYLETNGIFYKELEDVIDNVDVVAMDIKLPSSTQCQSYWVEHEKFLQVATQKDVFVKAVVSSATSKDDVLKAAKLVSVIDSSLVFYLQPNHFEIQNGAMSKCLEFQDDCLKYLNDVRVLPQVHKFMKVP